ncbi:MGDG synthase family glycosyltransferase [Natronoflexus pectinivorans]|uniref:Processive 1,2-diacylglycerol beta-glucosyltransferase/1,2-diacylglycerol 3-beta-galactosyltransferase n=1 Tax=Natronoflexus pectinivorans TaxID=682526 RepID=A0A4R2G8E9_9BACT|nr:glycosyltransferase [Natronoflexus pectinivorans]TCO04013.1 processive 1,2-diacylglycerol beta-glucosyltransferase/1,2-diacylglycerol 3-beta-galactosyltransferase [Natronoflexus pectinivorans]
MQQNYLFLYLKTGGGHLAPAKSVAKYIKVKYQNNINIDLFDGFANSGKWIKFFIEDGYRISQSSAVWVFELLYAINKIKPVALFTTFIVSLFIRKSLEKKIMKEHPDKIVIFHFFLIKPILEIINKNNLSIPVMVVVTDPFTAHPIWFLDKTPKFIVFSQRLKEHCLNIGIENSRVAHFPFILDEKFTQPMPSERTNKIKQELGFEPERKIILILGGGDGIPKGKKILKSFLQDNPDDYVAIVCGNNKELYRKAEKMKAKHQFQNLKLYTFIDFVHELISIADIVVTKCGASTFMEILLSGKIPVINNYIWEQEKGNMEFVRDNNLGIYERDINKLPLKTRSLLRDPGKLDYYKQNIQKASLRNGTPQVSKFIVTT